MQKVQARHRLGFREEREGKVRQASPARPSGEAAVIDLDHIWRQPSWRDVRAACWDLFYPPSQFCSALPPITRPFGLFHHLQGVGCQLVSTPLGRYGVQKVLVHVCCRLHRQMPRSLAQGAKVTEGLARWLRGPGEPSSACARRAICRGSGGLPRTWQGWTQGLCRRLLRHHTIWPRLYVDVGCGPCFRALRSTSNWMSLCPEATGTTVKTETQISQLTAAMSAWTTASCSAPCRLSVIDEHPSG